jgi:RsiW-degrading membrane proteinase PrsW (M82 family)
MLSFPPMTCFTFLHRRVPTLAAAAALALWRDRARAADNAALPSPTAVTSQVTTTSSLEFWLALGVLLFGFVVLFMQFILLRRTPGAGPEDVLRLFTVTIIVIGTLALIAIGYSSQQIAPALGLFGTILGYLLGRSDERQRGRQAGSHSEGHIHAAGGQGGESP